MSVVTPRYRVYVLCLLLAGYALDSLDRSILGVLLQPIKIAFGATDTQLGLLGGLAFAALYATMGVPAAIWADRYGAKRVLVLGMALWSSMTVLCGAATSFPLLLWARMGTALGESGANPSSQSILSGYFPPLKRSTVFGIFALGAPAGAMLGNALGGLGSARFGWRMTLTAAGVPGLLLAAVLLMSLRDPGTVAPDAVRPRSPAAWPALRELWGLRSFRHLCLACALHSVGIYAVATFDASFLIRRGWGSAGAGSLLALNGALGILGAVVGGVLADWLNRRYPRHGWQLRVAAFASLALVPVELATYLTASNAVLSGGLLLSGFLSSIFFGPSFAATQGLAGPARRATAAAALMFVKTMIGMGVGPLLVGAVSDRLHLSAGVDSLRYALTLVALFNLWSVAHFWTAGRHLDADLAPDPA